MRTPGATLHTLIYRLWALLPTRTQQAVQYVLGAKVTLGVSAVVRDAQGRILVVRHTYRQPAWGFPSGGVGAREQPVVALERELGEELGLRATVGPLLYADYYARRRHLTLYYGVSVEGTVRHDYIETDDHRYATVDELPALFGTPAPPWLLPYATSE